MSVLGSPGTGGLAEPVALVPVPGHPGPGVLGHLPVHQQGALERVQQVEDRAGAACAVRGEHEHRDARVQPGHPPRFVHPAARTGRRPPARWSQRPSTAGIWHPAGQEFVLPRAGRRVTSQCARTSGAGEVARYSRRRSSARRSSSSTRSQRHAGPALRVAPVVPSARRRRLAARPDSRRCRGRGRGELREFPGAAGQLEQDGQGQGAVPAEQQLPGAGSGKSGRAVRTRWFPAR